MTLAGSRVLVTGADGFIGSHLAEALVEEGAQVRAFVLYNSLGTWGWIEDLPQEKRSLMEVFPGDIRDQGRVVDAAKGVDCIFHLAALIAIPFSYKSPESYFQTNALGTLNVLQAARQTSVARVLVTSTSEVYGTAQYVPMDERHPLQAQSPYSASKIAADKVAESFRRSFGMAITTVRPFNTYGPRQSARAVIPTVITQLLSGVSTILLGNLSPTRDFNFVKDTVAAFVEIARSESTIGEEVNIATQTEISIRALAEKLIQMLQPRACVASGEERIRPAHSEVERLLGSNGKITALTSWRPTVGIDAGLEQTIAWFRRPGILDRYKAGVYNE